MSDWQISNRTGEHEGKYPYLHKEGALEEPLLNILWIACLPFIQAPQPVVTRCVVSISKITDFGLNADEKSGSLPNTLGSERTLTLDRPSHT